VSCQHLYGNEASLFTGAAHSPHIFDHLSNIDLIYIRRGIDISLSPRQKRTSSTKKKRKRRLPVFWLKIPLKDKKADVTLPLRPAHTPQHTRRPCYAADYDVAIRRARRAAWKIKKIALNEKLTQQKINNL